MLTSTKRATTTTAGVTNRNAIRMGVLEMMPTKEKVVEEKGKKEGRGETNQRATSAAKPSILFQLIGGGNKGKTQQVDKREEEQDEKKTTLVRNQQEEETERMRGTEETEKTEETIRHYSTEGEL